MFDEEIEKAVLYYIIFQKENFILEEKYFVFDRNKKIAKAIIQLRNLKKDISIISISEQIRANKKQIIDYISSLGENIYGTTAKSCYEKLKELTKKRELFNIAKDFMEQVQETESIENFSQEIIGKINTIVKSEQDEKETFLDKISKTTTQLQETWERRNDYSLYTGITDLDGMTFGLHNKELTIIGARPRSRKNNNCITNS